jgi:hypothetical protein
MSRILEYPRYLSGTHWCSLRDVADGGAAISRILVRLERGAHATLPRSTVSFVTVNCWLVILQPEYDAVPGR